MPVLLDRQRIAPEQIARLIAGFAAQRFQLPNKGAIRVGNDADFVLVDPAASATLAAEDLFQRHKQSPYLGSTFSGAVRRTILRGQTIFQDGAIAERTWDGPSPFVACLVRGPHFYAKTRINT